MNRSKFIKLMAGGACALATGAAGGRSAKVKNAPNIVFILADDQGWTALSERMDPDVAGSRNDFYQTPSLARLANEGMRFTQGYAPGR